MIPKLIHYCWFGGQPLDEKALKCIESWKKYFPDYQIIQWNESNFDISRCKFMQQAYEAKKWAFVSDVARLMIVYENGGIYFDTDVEVIKPYDDILDECGDGFMGFEKGEMVNSGLGFGAIQEHPFLKQLIDLYSAIDFETNKNSLSEITCVKLTQNLLVASGLIPNNEKQTLCDFTIYPSDYFCPINYFTGKLTKTKNTHSVHWYSMTWKSEEEQEKYQKVQKLRRLIGTTAADNFFGITDSIKKEGLSGYIKRHIGK